MDTFIRAIAIAARWFGAAILCFFAVVPGWILFHAVTDAVSDPSSLDWRWFLAVVVCSALMYFFLLIAYRAFTGRGRKQDGGLLPPLAIQAFGAAFAAIGASVSALALRDGKFVALLGGLFEFLVGAGVFRMAARRRKPGEAESAPP